MAEHSVFNIEIGLHIFFIFEYFRLNWQNTTILNRFAAFLSFRMLNLEIWSFEISSSIFFILNLHLWRIHILAKTRRQGIPRDFTFFKDRSRWRRLRYTGALALKTLSIWFDFIKLPAFTIIICLILWCFLLSFRIALVRIVFSLTFIKLIIFHLSSSFDQIDIRGDETWASHFGFHNVMSLCLCHGFWLDINDILIYF